MHNLAECLVFQKCVYVYIKTDSRNKLEWNSGSGIPANSSTCKVHFHLYNGDNYTWGPSVMRRRIFVICLVNRKCKHVALFTEAIIYFQMFHWDAIFWLHEVFFVCMYMSINGRIFTFSQTGSWQSFFKGVCTVIRETYILVYTFVPFMCVCAPHAYISYSNESFLNSLKILCLGSSLWPWGWMRVCGLDDTEITKVNQTSSELEKEVLVGLWIKDKQATV